jgi:hypothetical protein
MKKHAQACALGDVCSAQRYTPFGWKTLVVKRTLGGLSGYWSQKVMRKLKMPPSHGVSVGPKIVAAHTKIFSSLSGAALAPCQTHKTAC